MEVVSLYRQQNVVIIAPADDRPDGLLCPFDDLDETSSEVGFPTTSNTPAELGREFAGQIHKRSQHSEQMNTNVIIKANNRRDFNAGRHLLLAMRVVGRRAEYRQEDHLKPDRNATT